MGCQQPERMITECKPLGDPFEIPASSYSTNYYFVDTSYISLYEPYYLNDVPVVNPPQRVVETEVWISRIGSSPDPNELHARAFVHLPAIQGSYPDSLRRGYVEPGNIEETQFIKLDHAQYELTGDGYLGIIRLNNPVSDNVAIAIAYSRADGSQFGEFTRNVHFDSTFFASRIPILLKLVKPISLLSVGPYFRDPWRQLVKSIYPIRYPGVIKTQFHLDVFPKVAGALLQNVVLGQPLLAILGLDRLSSDSLSSPKRDGVFDYRPGRTIDQNRGDIILPYLRPFDDGFKRYFASIGQPLLPSSSVLLPQLYDSTTSTVIQRSTFTYVFVGSALHQ
jgi:hypothetical protein